MLKEFATSIEKSNIQITTLPKKTEAGNPDFRVWDGNQHIVGYIEAKDPCIQNLDQVEVTKQLKRYRNTFPNLILTNFFEFRLYRNGSLIEKVLIARPFIMHEIKTVPPLEKEGDFLKFLEKFFSFSLPKVYDAKTLAIELAKRTGFLRDEVITEELKEEEIKKGFILGFYEAFKKHLISGLTKEDFVDLYSQTITYGLFASRTRSENGFNRKLAYDNIPRTIGILRDVFRFISLGDIPQQMEWIIDDISEVLEVTDVKSLLSRFFHEGKGKDPIVHFYETFLAEYDPIKREKRGVYYTPEPVVSYIVRSLNKILKEYFKKTDGFASESVTVLDPAAGTLTFLAEASRLAVKEFISKYGTGGQKTFIKEHILKNFYAFELMMAPYAVGHLKISFLLEEMGYKLEKDERFNLYLTNTLEIKELAQSELPGTSSLSEESHLAGRIKKEQPVLVILGNPPYFGISANLSEQISIFEKGNRYISHYEIQDDYIKGGYKLIARKKEAKRRISIKQKTWIGELIEGYKIVDGKWLCERNPKWLHDDYVKFIRFAQWKIDNEGEGILGFITNHGYIDNPTFRGMRQSLMNNFNEIYILDLHGSLIKKEKCPDGSKDENIFDIQPGVAIGIFIKKRNSKEKCKVYHSEVWGLRQDKYDWLLENDIKTVNWQKIIPKSESYLFIPRDEKLAESYEKFLKLTEIFPINGVGMTTARDSFVIDMDKYKLINRIRLFKHNKMSDDELHEFFQIRKKKGWDIRKAWDTLQNVSDSDLESYVYPVLYRPFDTRWIFYHDSVVWRTVKRVMSHMMNENLGLISARSNKSNEMNHFFCSNQIMETKCGESTTQSSIFPLFLHHSQNQIALFGNKEKKSNINEKVFSELLKYYNYSPTPKEIFYYIYAILYSNIYRLKYLEFLKRDFPRVFFIKDKNLFQILYAIGERLVNLHLLKSTDLDSPIIKFQGLGEKNIQKINYDKKKLRVYINENQYFENISETTWEYQIGGYQICSKWLKDRKGKNLSLDDLKHYCKVATAIDMTIEIQKEIDAIYYEAERCTAF